EYSGKSYVIEIKIIYYYDSPAAVLEEGIEQILSYRDKIDVSVLAYLIIFDRRPKAKELSWDEKISYETDEKNNLTILKC
ncbi:MAG: hypothetical protein LBP87_04290, partial [Planctomycetaceae bacterium]|nr:hypothetical protein [Planctomycetaceae bacterium]